MQPIKSASLAKLDYVFQEFLVICKLWNALIKNCGWKHYEKHYYNYFYFNYTGQPVNYDVSRGTSHKEKNANIK